jgi:hypothetical protein
LMAVLKESMADEEKPTKMKQGPQFILKRISNNGAVAISVEYFVNIFDFNIA